MALTFLLPFLLLVLAKNLVAEEAVEEPVEEVVKEVVEEPVEEVVEEPVETELPAGICESLESEGDLWFDKAQHYLSVQFCEPSVWFDSFFSDKRIDEEARAGTHVRWQNDFVLTKGGTWAYASNINASFKLPKTKENLHIIFEGEEEESLRDVLPADSKRAKSDLGLLYEITKSERANFSARIKLSPSINFRYRYTWPVTHDITTRFTQELLRKDEANGTVSRLDFEKKINRHLLLRQSNSVTHSETFEGAQWDSSLVLYQRLSDTSALSYESSINKVTVPETYTTNMRVGVRFRQNAYREWLFYEIAPAYNWPTPLVTDVRERVWEIMFRLEINFINI